MTGYGKTIASTPQKKITVEIKSLNSKQLDIATRIPMLYREKEPEIRNIISQKLERGKIDFSISFDVIDDENITLLNKAVIKNYFYQIREISTELGIDTDAQILSSIIRLPEALKPERPELQEEEWNLVVEYILESVSQLDSYRIEEGKSIEKDMKNSISKILQYLGETEPFEPERILKVREKLSSLLTETPGSENIDMNRFEQELIYYIEKFDFNEEKVRLRKHCEYFLDTIDSPPPNGKILGFIAQEMGREINTIGSKANHASIQKLVVMMKDELEKIKEQTLNIL
ncbi:MAG: YicC family protein [Bacteroidales bacterium]|nr:YicC family protein [Bacteroidales bacterium]